MQQKIIDLKFLKLNKMKNKNIHLIPTKPNDETAKGIWIKKTRDWCNIYITNDEEIKEGDWSFDIRGFIEKVDESYDLEVINALGKKIILTTDQYLIKDGVQVIEDEFLEWFVQNSSCKKVDVELVSVNEFGSEVTVNSYGFDKFIYKIIIPKQEPNKTHYLDEIPNVNKESVLKMWKASKPHSFCETPEENFYEQLKNYFETTPKEKVNWKVVYEDSLSMQKCSNAGYENKISELQEQIKRSYSEEDMKQSFYAGIRKAYSSKKHSECWEEWFEQFKKK